MSCCTCQRRWNRRALSLEHEKVLCQTHVPASSDNTKGSAIVSRWTTVRDSLLYRSDELGSHHRRKKKMKTRLSLRHARTFSRTCKGTTKAVPLEKTCVLDSYICPKSFLDAGFWPLVHDFYLWLGTKLLSDFHPFERARVNIRWISVDGFDTSWIPRSFSCGKPSAPPKPHVRNSSEISACCQIYWFT